MEEYTSEFEAPIYSMMDIRAVGTQVVRTVLMHGEVMEFTVDRQVYHAGLKLQTEGPDSQSR